MSRRKITAGQTGVSLGIFVQDTSSTIGGGLSGLVFNTAGLVAEYRREGQSTWTAISLVAGTLGTYVSGGFIADGSLAGAYEFDPPNAAFAVGAKWVKIRLRGAANMLPVLLEFELSVADDQVAAFGAITTLGTNAPSNWLDANAIATDAVNEVRDAIVNYDGGSGQLYLTLVSASGAANTAADVAIKLDTMLELDITTYQFIAGAFANAPRPLTAAETRSALGLSTNNLDAQLGGKPTLGQIEASTVLAKEATVSAVGAVASARPTLGQIEGSTVLAKKSDVQDIPKYGDSQRWDNGTNQINNTITKNA